MNFDLFIPIAPTYKDLFVNHIDSIVKYIQPAKVVVVAVGAVIDELKQLYPEHTYIDEDKLVPELTFDYLKTYFEGRNAETKRVGWYFQQFLKMGYALLDSANKHYLVWDVDTVPYKRINFFAPDNKIYFSYCSEEHQPYFKTIEHLLGLRKSFSKSFIVEHMMIDQEIMKELIDKIAQINPFLPWFRVILDAVDSASLSESGFSEYETYGTYMYTNYKDRYKPRRISHYRFGEKRFRPFEFKLYSLVYDTICFEEWKKRPFVFHLWKFVVSFFRKFSFVQPNY